MGSGIIRTKDSDLAVGQNTYCPAMNLRNGMYFCLVPTLFWTESHGRTFARFCLEIKLTWCVTSNFLNTNLWWLISNVSIVCPFSVTGCAKWWRHERHGRQAGFKGKVDMQETNNSGLFSARKRLGPSGKLTVCELENGHKNYSWFSH